MKKVITYGTFDLFHQGHYNILKRAKEAGDYLIVGVTGESYDIERGKLSVQDSLEKRIENVKKTGFADKIIIEEYLGQKISDIIKYDIDIMVIGSDWKGKFDHLNKYCEVKYLERTKDISSTQLREKMLTYKLGFVTDNLDDNCNVTELKYVSGIHVESVFSEQKEIANRFCYKYELDKAYTKYEEFLESIDIVYIKTTLKKREKYVRQAINAGKHVVCDVPISINPDSEIEIKKMAKEKGVVFFTNMTTIYLQAFGQLLWMTRGNIIGNILSVKCGISQKTLDCKRKRDFFDTAYYPICVILKILGVNYLENNCKLIKDENGNVLYGLLEIKYDNSIAIAEISKELDVSNGMTIIGTNGTIYVPEDWWRIGYFKLKLAGEKDYKHYCSNFEGNGFRYLAQVLLEMIRTKKSTIQMLTDEEAFHSLSILKDIEGM